MLQHRLELAAEKIKDGDTVLIRAVAWDKRDISDWGLDLKPQQAASPWATIRVVAEEEKAAASLEQSRRPAGGDPQDPGDAVPRPEQDVKIPWKRRSGGRGLGGRGPQPQADIQKSSHATW